MPGRLPAPTHLLDAIFQQTNKLGWQDRQAIIRFLSGEDPRMLEQRRQRNNRSDVVDRPADSGSRRHARGDRFSGAGELDFPRSSERPPDSALMQPSTGRMRGNDDSGAAEESGGSDVGGEELLPSRSNRTANSNSIRQILLHEERRTELRPVQQPSSAAASERNNNSGSSSRENNDGNARHPTDLGSFGGGAGRSVSDQQQVSMKPFTIIDQIIFEMDYRTGCWRKLRRRIRMADRRSSFNSDFISDGRVLNADGDEVPSVYLSTNSAPSTSAGGDGASGPRSSHGPGRNYSTGTSAATASLSQQRSLRAFDNLFSRSGGTETTASSEGGSDEGMQAFRINRPAAAIPTTNTLLSSVNNTANATHPDTINRPLQRLPRSDMINSGIRVRAGSQSASLNDFSVPRTAWLPWSGEPMTNLSSSGITRDQPGSVDLSGKPAASINRGVHDRNLVGR